MRAMKQKRKHLTNAPCC